MAQSNRQTEIIEIAMDRHSELNDWENRFLNSIEFTENLTYKQEQKLDQIAEKLGV